MCFNNQPRAPKVAQLTPPPQIKPLRIAERSTLPTKELKDEKETKPVAFGAKSKRDGKQAKRNAASLLVPMNIGGSGSGGGGVKA